MKNCSLFCLFYGALKEVAKLFAVTSKIMNRATITLLLISYLYGADVCRVTREFYLNTEEFIDAVALNLEAKLREPTVV